MHPRQVADLVDAIANSLASNPEQVHLSIEVTGTNVSGPLTINTMGGGPASTTVGLNVSAQFNSNAQVYVYQAAAQAREQQVAVWTAQLAELSTALRQPAHDHGLVRRLLSRLKEAGTPAVVSAAISVALQWAGISV